MKYVSLEKWFSTEKHIGNERVWGMQQLQQQIKGKNCENTKKNIFSIRKQGFYIGKHFCCLWSAQSPLPIFHLQTESIHMIWMLEMVLFRDRAKRECYLLKHLRASARKKKFAVLEWKKTNMF